MKRLEEALAKGGTGVLSDSVIFGGCGILIDGHPLMFIGPLDLDPSMGEDIMNSADYLRAELYNAAEHEMIVKLDDFMRRRSKIDLVVHDDDVRSSPGLHEVAEILFGDRADARLQEYFAEKATIG